MSILLWLQQLHGCRECPEKIDFEGVDAGVLELRERVERLYNSEGESEILYEMAELLSSVADDLDQFLDSGLFYHLEGALQKSQEMANLKDLLRQQIETAHPDLESGLA